MTAGRGRKSEGLRLVTCLGDVGIRPTRFSSPEASAMSFLKAVSSVAAVEEATVSFIVRAVEWWKSSSEHERDGVLWKAKQMEPYCLLVIVLYQQTAFLWRSLRKVWENINLRKQIPSGSTRSTIQWRLCLSPCDEQLLYGRLNIELWIPREHDGEEEHVQLPVAPVPAGSGSGKEEGSFPYILRVGRDFMLSKSMRVCIPTYTAHLYVICSTFKLSKFIKWGQIWKKKIAVVQKIDSYCWSLQTLCLLIDLDSIYLKHMTAAVLAETPAELIPTKHCALVILHKLKNEATSWELRGFQGNTFKLLRRQHASMQMLGADVDSRNNNYKM